MVVDKRTKILEDDVEFCEDGHQLQVLDTPAGEQEGSSEGRAFVGRAAEVGMKKLLSRKRPVNDVSAPAP